MDAFHDKRRGRTLMVQGTASDVGKSVVVAALCRIFLQDGHRVAPFKSQNMSLNSYVTPDGKEIGRAQGMQADACRIAATTDMNPILLKPTKEMVSQVVVHGKPLRDYDARSYREHYLPKAESIVKEALERLRGQYDAIVIEGAGSPAEVNLKDRDIVNMRLAGWADAPVVLVADIDRGGVFAAIVGTLDILEPEERDRVKGFIINKFRGDVSLLKPGLDWLEQRTGKPVLGVVPYLHDLGLEDEDSASLDAKRQRGQLEGKRRSAASDRGETDADNAERLLDIAVIRLPRISNFTDFDPLFAEDDVSVRYVTAPEQLGKPDAILLPGSKNTVEDLLFLRETGLEAHIMNYVLQGGRLAGICGGYQMLGRTLHDPYGVESSQETVSGLGLFPAVTTFARDKRTERVAGFADGWGEAAEPLPIDGYEIHMGETRFVEPVAHPFRVGLEREAGPDRDLHPEGCMSGDGKIWGTYVHGILHNDGLRREWLNRLRADNGWEPLPITLFYREKREAAFDKLADHVRSHLDMERIYAMMAVEATEL
ncbi:cobyric acid synthase [Paenibacillus contaminans]|uniref:Cobyric acid synthase n=1 Tax=Paenibacillus contaminans TaxID=450362 RepID=A0A329LY84_9BACL|nr:cobyric acid synthase [Paenibacillus contaminans]RAV12945.1 cobyric acid synthase CobQ [Paenibacillus contaminans]